MHYVMTCEGEYPIAPIRGVPKLPGGSWYKGRRLRIDVPQPLEYSLKPGASGNLKAMYDGLAFPLIRTDLLDILSSNGVDNLEVFDAVIRGGSGEDFHDYRAFNVVGLISATDLEESEVASTTTGATIDVDFDSLTIDEDLAEPFDLFRLAENVSAIIVSEKLKTAIEEQGVPGMVFYGPGEWSG